MGKELKANHKCIILNYIYRGFTRPGLPVIIFITWCTLLSLSCKVRQPSLSGAQGTVASHVHNSADPQLISSGRRLLDWLYTLPDKTDNKVISGQYHMSTARAIHDQTGIWVGIVGDLFNNNPGGAPWNDFSSGERNRTDMLEHWKAGGIVFVHMPLPNIKNRTSNRDSDFSEEDMTAAVTKGTQINTNLNEWLKAWAVHARWLANQGVVLIARPLHEMNCCFWYRDKSVDSYVNLYRYIVNYLTKTENLHNLIFSWGPSAFSGRNASDDEYTKWYPGNDYVDIVGLDVYEDLTNSRDFTRNEFRAYSMLVALGKPFALNEIGPRPAAKKVEGRADYRKLIDQAIKQYCPRTIFWFSWSVDWSMDGKYNDGVKELLEDPWVINRDEIPKF